MSTLKPFTVIVDCHGTAQDILSFSLDAETVSATLKALDLQYPGDSPHSALAWNGSIWHETTRRSMGASNQGHRNTQVVVRKGNKLSVKKSFTYESR